MKDIGSYPKELRTEFPIYHGSEYENVSGSRSFQIGVNLDYPPDLIRKLAAACISVELGLKSVDGVVKRYLSNVEPAVAYGIEQNKCMDRQVNRFINGLSDVLFGAHRNAPSSGFFENLDHAGLIVCNLTMMRLPNSLEESSRCADRGSLYECCAIIRHALEAFCWAMSIRGFAEADEVFGTSVTKSVGLARRSVPEIGIFYGWLSKHAHWHPDSHWKALTSKEGRGGIMLRSPAFKAEAYIVCLLFLLLILKLLSAAVEDISWRSIAYGDGAQMEATIWLHALQVGDYLKESQSDIQVLLNAFREEQHN